MARFKLNNLTEEKRIQMIAEFYDAIHALKNRNEVRLFFRDLLTPDEIAMLMRRLEVAVLLLAGFTYDQIKEMLGVSKDKIVNVQKSLLRYGDGYKVVVKRLLDARRVKIKKVREKEKMRKSSFERIKKKYPIHFLFFNIFDEIGDLLREKEDIRKALLDTPSRKYR